LCRTIHIEYLASLPAEDGATVGEILGRMCAVGKRYKVSLTTDPRLVNVLPIHPSDEVKRLLELRLPRFDMSVDAWPSNWFMQVPDFSAEVRSRLENYYNQWPHPPSPSGFPGVNLETDRQPPHLELHLRNVTVKDVLNALASRYLDWADSENAAMAQRGGAVTYPVFALGWELRLPETDQIPINVWIHSVFGTFPESQHQSHDNVRRP
jgi:hypothetical protein